MDQLCFLYQVLRCIYNSPLRNKLVNEDPEVLNNVIPKLVAYHSLVHMMRIFATKEEEANLEKRKNENEQKEQNARDQEEQEDEEEEKKGEDDPTEADKLKAKIAEQMEANEQEVYASDYQKEKAQVEKDTKEYGRLWVWDGYFREKNREVWLRGADILKHINEHVLEDIEDYIILSGFKPKKEKDFKKIQGIVETMRVDPNKKRKKEEIEEDEIIQQKQKYLCQMRPPQIWNFFEDKTEEDKHQEEQKHVSDDSRKRYQAHLPHVINVMANPANSYQYEEDRNRVQKAFVDIDNIAWDLKNNEQVRWKKLVELCIEIFKFYDKQEKTGQDIA